MQRKPSRRAFLIGAAAGGLVPLASARAATGAARPGRALPDPFTLGIASGDPSADGFVLWTRLAPEPLAPDGHGGMPSRDVEVAWQIAADERFRTVVRSGTVTARRDGGPPARPGSPRPTSRTGRRGGRPARRAARGAGR
ncbi:hypothetical protein Sru01_22970 [Sphaerisporangium rufum]|uniref:Phospholipase D N-terminal domain-containing protein n=1 Tax=Sphaerisporangium rufum TaxID=1381558 RepID=A0A919R517_9ACTN|nr:hypothetical protein Sru01_22970 [Sphaerisporangium rufum]